MKKFLFAFLVLFSTASFAQSIKVELTIDDPRFIVGVEYARDLYNNTNCPIKELAVDEKPSDCKRLTSEEYILYVARSAVESYAVQAERSAKLKSIGLE